MTKSTLNSQIIVSLIPKFAIPKFLCLSIQNPQSGIQNREVLRPEH